MTVILEDGSSDIAGGDQFILGGTTIDMDAVQDPMTGASLSALWSPSTAGSGRILPVPTAAQLRFLTGATASSSAFADAVTPNLVSDEAINHAWSRLSIPSDGTITTEVSLMVDANTQARVLLMSTRTERTIRVLVTEPGIVVFDHTQNLDSDTSQIRWQKTEEAVSLFLQDSLFISLPWAVSDAAFRFGVQNSATAVQGTSVFSNYLRLPVVLVGGEPCSRFRLAINTRVVAEAPATSYPGEATIVAFGAASSATADDPLPYTADDRHTVGQTASQRLYVQARSL